MPFRLHKTAKKINQIKVNFLGIRKFVNAPKYKPGFVVMCGLHKGNNDIKRKNASKFVVSPSCTPLPTARHKIRTFLFRKLLAY